MQEFLKSKRALLRYTQKDMAEKLGMSPCVYTLKEAGKRNFTLDELRSMIPILNITGKEILHYVFKLESE